MNPILTSACRTSQAVRSMKNSLQKQMSCVVETGPLAGLAIPERLREGKLEKPLLLISREDDAGKTALISSLTEAGLDYALWEMKEPLRLQDVENIRLFTLGERCDSLIALGEPWLLCAGKLAALRMAQKGRTAEELMTGSAGKKPWPLLVIPTVPKGAAVSDEVWAKDCRGYWTRRRSPYFVPVFCLADPELMPSQSREEYIEQSLCMLALCLEEALDPKKEEIRPALLITADDILKDLRTLAKNCFAPTAEYYGRVFRSAPWQGGYAWALAEESARLLEISKGTALAALLPALLHEYWERTPQSLAHLDVMTAGQCLAAEEEEDGDDFRFVFLDELRSLYTALGLKEKLPALTEEQILLLAEKVHKRVNPALSCPLVLSRRDLRRLLSLCAEAAPVMELPPEEKPSRLKMFAARLKRKEENEEASEYGEEGQSEE